MAGIMVVGASGIGRADDLKVSGYGDITLDLLDETRDNACSSPTSATLDTNCDEFQFNTTAEVDFEKKQGPVTVRLDLDFPAVTGVGTTAGGNNIVANIDMEQMRFDWMLPVGSELGLTLTGGVFNSPIGFEAQDAPDKLQVTNGQLFGLVPSNLAGLKLSGGNNMVNGGLIFANDFRNAMPNLLGGVGEEHSAGAIVSFTPMPEVGLTVGYLDSGILPTEAIINAIVSGTVMPSQDLSLLYALEYVGDEVNTGMGITLHAKHGKHGLTVRYDMVDCDPGSSSGLCTAGAPGSPNEEPTTLTLAFQCSLEENLKLNLEWKSTDPDSGSAPKTDQATLQFVALF